MTKRKRKLNREREISPKMKDYLRVVYDLSQRESPVAPSAVARRMGVSPATATEMLQRLSRAGLADHRPYAGVVLTGEGERVALEVVRHHRLIETYLALEMGLDWDQVHEEAHRLEHHISEALEDRMDEILGHPDRDPHGSPIPPKEGPFEAPGYGLLADVAEGRRVVVREVVDDDAERLRFLADLGLRPDVELLVLEVQPFDGPVLVRIEGRELTVGRSLAKTVTVESVQRRK